MAYGPSGFAPNQVSANYLSGQRAADASQANMQQYQQNILNQQRVAKQDEEASQTKAAQQLYLASQYALQAPQGQTKAFVEQNFPDLVTHAGSKWASATEEDVRSELQGAAAKFGSQAGVGPAPVPVKWEEVKGPRGSIIQRNPQTGEQKQVVGPDNSQQPSASGPKFRPLTPAEYTQYGLPPGTTAQIDTSTGKIDLINRPTAASVGRPLPPAITKGLIENSSNMRKIDAAIAALDAYPDAFGAKNYLGDTVRQRTDPKGVDPRAKVADIGSLIIHDRSGAAVSASEFPRLAPFVPQSTDDPATVRKKLENLKANIQMMQEETQQIYSPDQGYKEFNAGGPATPNAVQAPPAQPATQAPAGQRLTPEQAAALPPGTPFIGMDGQPRVRH